MFERVKSKCIYKLKKSKDNIMQCQINLVSLELLVLVSLIPRYSNNSFTLSTSLMTWSSNMIMDFIN
jgi:hypothetical protein